MIKKAEILLTLILLVSCTINSSTGNDGLQIHDIQGCGHISPFNGKKVDHIKGVVTHKVSNGFTMQSMEPDEQSCSSEGIFVFTDKYPTVLPGDLVRIDGIVTDFVSGGNEDFNLSQTEIIANTIDVLQTNFDLPDPILLDELGDQIPRQVIDNDGMTKFDINEDGLDFFESLESMLVEIDQGVVIAPRNEYNEILILPDAFINGNIISKNSTLLSQGNDLNPEKVMIKLPSSFDELINAGDNLIAPMIGVMDYSYGNYKVLSVNPVRFSKSNQLIDPFIPVSNGLTITSYNVENLSLFGDEKRFEQIAAQIVEVLSAPDIVLLHEIMDDSGTADDGEVNAAKTIERLVEEIEKNGGPLYSYSDSPPQNNGDGGIQGGNIRSILLFREDHGIQLETTGSTNSEFRYDGKQFMIQKNPYRIGENSQSFSNSRKPSVWLLRQNGIQFFVVGVHLISQGSNTPDWGSQQPPLKNAEQQRITQAKYIQEFVTGLFKKNNDVPVIIAGDMNDMPWSETIATMMSDNMINTGVLDDENEQYSYLFEGNAQQLDYILVNKNLAESIVQTRFIHINSIVDRSLQISDHDPVIVEIIITP